MNVFLHHLYEYKKGIRRLFLYTTDNNCLVKVSQRLKKDGISHWLAPIGEKRTNVFFGSAECIEVIRSFGCKSLSDLNHEEDFILGALLGYDLGMQSQRYLQRKIQ